MADSIGAKLRNARIARGLTLEDVATSTCIRPDKLAALEAMTDAVVLRTVVRG
jgi:cytoskeletal protein RodZ